LIWVKAGLPVSGDLTGMSEQPLMDETTAKILSLAEETRYAPNGIVSRTLLRTPGQRVVLFGFAEGQELTEHTSTQTAIVHILTGECEFVLAGQAHSLKSGDLIYMPPNLPHSVRATRQFSMLLTLSRTESAASPSTTTQTTP
jgi:quercetin dioxygenase-like cupin family protein